MTKNRLFVYLDTSPLKILSRHKSTRLRCFFKIKIETEKKDQNEKRNCNHQSFIQYQISVTFNITLFLISFVIILFYKLRKFKNILIIGLMT